MKLLTIIVNYCTAPHVLEGLEKLVPQLEALGDSAVWVVDNKSPDDSVSVLRAAFRARGYGDHVRLIEAPKNGGFGYGNNVGIRAALALPAPPAYFYLLNPDAKPEPGAIDALVRFLDREPNAAIAGTSICDPDGTPHTSAFPFPTLLGEFEASLSFGPVARLLRDDRFAPQNLARTSRVDWVSGASMALRREALSRIGLFDEDFFLYFEELDLCHRAARAGCEIWLVREAVVTHIGSVATGVTGGRRKPRYWFESRARYWRKNQGTTTLWAANALCLAGMAGLRARQRLLGKDRDDRPHFIRDFVRYNMVPRTLLKS